MQDVALSLPMHVSGQGATRVLLPDMDDREREALLASAQVIRDAIASVDA